MEVSTTPVPLGKYGVLIQNLGPDDLYVGESGVTSETGVLLEVGDTLSRGFSENEIFVVSDGTSDIRTAPRSYNSDKLYTKEELPAGAIEDGTADGALQIGSGSNNQTNSLAVGASLRLNQTEPTTEKRNGDVWVDTETGQVTIRSGGMDVAL